MAKIDTQYDQKGWKSIPFGAAHTYIAHIRDYPPPPPGSFCYVNYHGLTVSELTACQCQIPLWDVPAGNIGTCIHYPGLDIYFDQYNFCFAAEAGELAISSLWAVGDPLAASF